jgi:hypothetical protein
MVTAIVNPLKMQVSLTAESCSFLSLALLEETTCSKAEERVSLRVRNSKEKDFKGKRGPKQVLRERGNSKAITRQCRQCCIYLIPKAIVHTYLAIRR